MYNIKKKRKLMENNLTDITYFIQAAVAPVFLLAGVAGLLNVFTGRLSRIIDKLEQIDIKIYEEVQNNPKFIIDEKIKTRRIFLIKRMKNINWSIFLMTYTGFMVAMVILTIFASELFYFNGRILISILFVTSMVSLASSLLLFLKEIRHTILFIKVKNSLYE